MEREGHNAGGKAPRDPTPDRIVLHNGSLTNSPTSVRTPDDEPFEVEVLDSDFRKSSPQRLNIQHSMESQGHSAGGKASQNQASNHMPRDNPSLSNSPTYVKTPDSESFKVEMLDSNVQNFYQQKARAEPVRYYDEVAVLLIKWADELDELKVGPEVEELRSTFRDRYGFNVTAVELNAHTNAQTQLDHHVTDHIHKFDSQHNLLIVYYSGHGVFYDDQRILQFVPSTSPRSKAFQTHSKANWNRMDETLRSSHVESDVLVILDTSYASNLCQIELSPSHEKDANYKNLDSTNKSTQNTDAHEYASSGRSVELLAACSFNDTTAAPGLYSFTRALIDALNQLHDEDPYSSFTTWHLNQMIQRSPKRVDTASQLWSRLPNRDGSHICLGMFPCHTIDRLARFPSDKTTDNRSTSAQGASSQGPSGQGASAYRPSSVNEEREHKVTSSQDRNTYHDAASDSAYESGFSDTASMWSVAFSEDSQSSYGGLQQVTQSATKKMAEVFWQNSELHSLYQEASTKMPTKTFMKFHDDILKVFFESLRSETANDKQLKTVRILRHRAHRQQVTEWIYNLTSPKLDEETLQARQNFLTQRETRDEMLERYLQGDSKPVKADEQSEHAVVPDDDSSEDEEEDPLSLEELNSIVSFLIGGPSFEMFKINLYSIAHPETAITEALRTGNCEIVQLLLAKNFNRVAVGEYAWIKELDAAGYTKADIAQLLMEEITDSPWIFFTPQAITSLGVSSCNPYSHVEGCIHSGRLPDPHIAKIEGLAQSESLVHAVHELCGLAGVTPSSKDKDNWNGHVQFADDNVVAKVTYAMPSVHPQDSDDVLLARCVHTLQRLVLAAGRLQNSHVCCNSYTVIIHNNIPAFHVSNESDQISTVRLHKIKMGRLLKLLNEAELVNDSINRLELRRDDVKNLHEAALSILGVLGRHHFPLLEQLTYHETLHLVALATQFASLGLLSYSQAHLAPIQPFFMDTALEEVMLLGIGYPQEKNFHISARTTSLTCLGDMLRSKVLVFSVEPMRCFGVSPSFGPRASCKYDVVASAEDLIDTWDGGGLIVSSADSATRYHAVQDELLDERAYFAISLGGGIISPVAIKEDEKATVATEAVFHWASGSELQTYHQSFTKSQRVRVGALVTLNESCIIDEDHCWRSSAPAFEMLGVQDSVWRHDESQYGGQAGQYVLLQYNRTKHKIPGTTLKTVVLRGIQSDAYLARNNLNDLWGVQVSFCTGVARRVPLRLLMADLMPVVAETMPDSNNIWKELNDQNRAIEAFQSDTVMSWFNTLEQHQKVFVDQLMRNILIALEPTGINEEGTELTVAWIYQNPPYRCFRISCNDKKNSWMRVLADSSDCATFAYIVTHCLETSTVKCRSPCAHWQSTAPLLETAVLRHNMQPSQPLGPLEHKKMYFFKKMDSLLQVTVEKQMRDGPVSLYVSPSSIPAKFRQRLYNLERMRNQVSRIRERRDGGEIGAEAVAITAKAEIRS